MARKTIQVMIETPGRDQGKLFEITELSAMRAERWARRALCALGKSGAEIPDDVANAGLAGIAAMGIRAISGVDTAEMDALMDEMLTTVSLIPDPSKPFVKRPLRSEDDIEEVTTLLRIREEVLSLHVGFSLRDYRLSLMAARQMENNTPNTSTSPQPSGQ